MMDTETRRRIETLESRLSQAQTEIRNMPNVIHTHLIDSQRKDVSKVATGVKVTIDFINYLKQVLNYGFEWVSNKVNVKAAPNEGIQVIASGVGTLRKANYGISADSAGLYLLVEANKGLALSSSGLATVLEANKGLSVGASGLATKLKSGGGLAVGSDGLFIGASIVDYSGTSTVTGWSAYTVKRVLYLQMEIGIVFVNFQIEGTSNATTSSFTLPYDPGTNFEVYANCMIKDNGGAWTMGGLSYMASGSTTVNLYPDATAGLWTGSGDKGVLGQFFLIV